MRKWLSATAITAVILVASTPAASARGLEPETPDSFRFFWVAFVLFALAAIGTSIYRFVRVREMGLNRGLSERDATTTALFSDNVGAAALSLRDDDSDVETRLAKLEELRTKGLITDDEASERRTEILDEL